MDFIRQFAGFAIPLFLVIDPLAGVPTFLAMTPGNTPRERRTMARRGCCSALGILVFFILCGPGLLVYFGIGPGAVKICGGVLLFAIALEMLYGRITATGTSSREARLAEAKADISLVPLAFPLLAGPGAITTCLLFAGAARSVSDYLGILLAATGVLGITWLVLRHADSLERYLGPFGQAIVTRMMGLLLGFLATQYVIDGLRGAFPV